MVRFTRAPSSMGAPMAMESLGQQTATDTMANGTRTEHMALASSSMWKAAPMRANGSRTRNVGRAWRIGRTDQGMMVSAGMVAGKGTAHTIQQLALCMWDSSD